MKNIYLLLLVSFFGFGQTQIGQSIDGIAGNSLFGRYLVLSGNGNVLAATARIFTTSQYNGYVSVFNNVDGVWTQIGNSIFNDTVDESFGYSISLSENGNILAIGSPYNNGNVQDSGQVYIYENQSGVWNQVSQVISNIVENNHSGSVVSLSSDGTIVAVSSNGVNSSGCVRIYKSITGIWTQIGQNINGEANFDYSGSALTLSSDGTIVAIGAFGNDGNVDSSGHVRIFKNFSGVWTQIGQDINGESIGDSSGVSVSLSADGTIVAIGAGGNDGNGVSSGHIRIYKNISGVWTKIGQDIDGEAPGDASGGFDNVSLSADGTIVAIGANGNYGNNNQQATGHVRIYKNFSGNWMQVGQDIDGEAIQDHAARTSLSSDGNIVAISSLYHSGNGYNSGQVKIYDLSSILKSDIFVLENFSIYPNPTKESITITLQENLILEKVNIYNTLGQLIKTYNNTVINVSAFTKGSYFFEVITNKGKANKIIIVE